MHLSALRGKNRSVFDEVMPKILLAPFFPDTVYLFELDHNKQNITPSLVVKLSTTTANDDGSGVYCHGNEI